MRTSDSNPLLVLMTAANKEEATRLAEMLVGHIWPRVSRSCRKWNLFIVGREK